MSDQSKAESKVIELKEILSNLKSARLMSESLKKEAEKEAKELTKLLASVDQAQAILQKVAEETQQQVQHHISDVVTLALEAVFDDPYSFVVKFASGKGKTDADFFFERNGELLDPIRSTGGGAVDVASFALRIAAISIKRNRIRPMVALDEPFRFLSKDLHNRASDMIKEISEKLGIQFLIITHSANLAESSDRVFLTRKQSRAKNLSVVETLTGGREERWKSSE